MRHTAGLDQWIHQGYHGEAFVRALAASAGLVAARADLDVTGEDFTIGHPGRLGSLRHPKIEVQVKSWSTPTGNRSVWRYRMRADHYNELAGGDFYLPRYLILVIVPADPERYAISTPDALRLHHAGYWASFANRPTIADQDTVTVDVPRSNLLTVASLQALLISAAVPGQRRPS